jgi:hypothetical protein
MPIGFLIFLFFIILKNSNFYFVNLATDFLNPAQFKQFVHSFKAATTLIIMTLIITAFSIMILVIMDLIATLSIHHIQ